MDEDQLKEEFYQRLRLGLSSVESNGKHNAQNPQSTAAGKYQFTDYWLERAGKDSIKTFAKNSKVFNVPNSLEDFKADKELQEAYFSYYAKNVIYHQAKSFVKGSNPLGLSLDQAGAILHFQGYNEAKQQIDSGKLAKKTKKGVNGAKYDNISVAEYVNKYTKTLAQNRIAPISKKATIDDKEKQKIIANFQQRNDDINKLKEGGVEVRESLRKKLYQEVVDNGDKEIINDYIEKKNIEGQKEYNIKLEEYNELKSVLEKLDINYNVKNEKGKLKRTIKDYSFFKLNQDSDVKQRNKLAKKYPDLFLKTINSAYPSPVDSKKIIAKVESLHKELTGNDVKINLKDLSAQGFYAYPEGDKTGKFNLKDFNVTGDNYTKLSPISLTPSIKEIPEESEKEEEKKDNKKPESKTTTSAETKKPEAGETTLADDYFNNALGLAGVDGSQLNYEPGKKELPIDAITGLALGLIGNNQAKQAKIPLRTEEISQAMKSYTAELAERSKSGLPVEIEAMMKNQLADAYQGGLANIVNASSGNAAVVLGNLGSLEQAKTKGLVAIQVADYEAKDRAFQQYGQALQYANEFDARRDIANHGIKYTEAKEKQAEGKQLATAGFAKLIDSLKYDKENGPGSANDMYRSLLMQQMFGFDPKMKDDGTGTVPGTKSYYDNQKGLKQAELEGYKELKNKYNTLNPQAKGLFNKVLKQTQDKSKLNGLVDYFQQNPNADASIMSTDNIDIALERNDFSVLALSREAALNPKKTLTEGESGILGQNTASAAVGGLGGGLTNTLSNITAPKIPTLATNGFNVNPEAVGGNGLTDPNFLIDAETISGNNLTDPNFLINQNK